MSSVTQTELQEFSLFLTEQVRSGVKMSPEEALDLWRAEHQLGDELEEDDDEEDRKFLEALARSDAGVPGTPHEEFDREFRAQHGLPPK